MKVFNFKVSQIKPENLSFEYLFVGCMICIHIQNIHHLMLRNLHSSIIRDSIRCLLKFINICSAWYIIYWLKLNSIKIRRNRNFELGFGCGHHQSIILLSENLAEFHISVSTAELRRRFWEVAWSWNHDQ